MNENKIAHLGFIQSVIERMANNSAAIKGWSMGIVAAIIGLGIVGKGQMSDIANWIVFGCSCVIIIVMWLLDSFYLYQEKLYRELYGLIKDKNDKDIDFSMDARRKTILQQKGKAPCYFAVIKNRTIMPFYLPQLIVSFAFFVLPMIIEFISNQ